VFSKITGVTPGKYREEVAFAAAEDAVIAAE
jgi:hypothetical protein